MFADSRESFVVVEFKLESWKLDLDLDLTLLNNFTPSVNKVCIGIILFCCLYRSNYELFGCRQHIKSRSGLAFKS